MTEDNYITDSQLHSLSGEGEIVIYQPNESIRLEVKLEDETVWLTQAQMAELFSTTPQNVTLHIRNIYKEEELEKTATCKESLQVQKEGKRLIHRKQKIYNLDIIISVGYRIKSKRGTQFRQWANNVLKDYLLRGYSINRRLDNIEKRMSVAEEKIAFFVRTSLPPQQGIFFDGQIFDAYTLVCDLVRSAHKSITLIDNFVDDSVLKMLDKRQAGVTAKIYTKEVSQQLMLDKQKHNAQYPEIAIEAFNKSHDRFLLIDDEVYHVGASLKDLGKKWFAIMKMNEITATQLLSNI